MMPIGPLMIEHRLSERMGGLLGQEAMLAEFAAIDRKMIHGKYRALVEAYEGTRA